MIWECSMGHIWKARFHSIYYDKTWCPTCWDTRRGTSITLKQEEVVNICKKYYFEVLSKYVNSYEKLTVMCVECKYTFDTTYHKISHDSKCPKCSLRPRANLQEAEDFVSLKGGKVIGFADKSRSKSTWECSKGHQWRSAWSTVKKGSWCPFCAGKKSVSDLHKKAVAILYQHKRWDAAKGYECDLNLDFIVDTLTKKCIYCDKPASNVDRVDCNIGHLQSNCVPCCGRCNMVRSNRITHAIMFEVGNVFKRFNI